MYYFITLKTDKHKFEENHKYAIENVLGEFSFSVYTKEHLKNAIETGVMQLKSIKDIFEVESDDIEIRVKNNIRVLSCLNMTVNKKLTLDELIHIIGFEINRRTRECIVVNTHGAKAYFNTTNGNMMKSISNGFTTTYKYDNNNVAVETIIDDGKEKHIKMLNFEGVGDNGNPNYSTYLDGVCSEKVIFEDGLKRYYITHEKAVEFIYDENRKLTIIRQFMFPAVEKLETIYNNLDFLNDKAFVDITYIFDDLDNIILNHSPNKITTYSYIENTNIVKNITEYANTNNKITALDFLKSKIDASIQSSPISVLDNHFDDDNNKISSTYVSMIDRVELNKEYDATKIKSNLHDWVDTTEYNVSDFEVYKIEKLDLENNFIKFEIIEK